MKPMPLVDGKIDELHHRTATYAIYKATHEQYSLGNISLKRANNIVGSMLGASSNAWRVIGITQGALELAKEFGFLKNPKGVQRAHLFNRIDTIRDIMECANPFREMNLFNHWQERDKTVLCLTNENRKITEHQHHKISNPDGFLFANAYIGYSFHRERERKIFEQIWRSLPS